MHRTQSQRGFTLPEILVAIAVFTIVILGALMVYDQQNKSFKAGVESANMQQNTRVAFDKLMSDIRMAGFDFDRDGIPSGSSGGVNFQQQPDEQIEFMGQSAIVFRGNFNFAGGTDNGREPAYQPAAFPVVTTANNEIVGYVLKSDDDSKNVDDLVFYADVAKPRDVYLSGSPLSGPPERKVIIPKVDLSNANPPYTLYRFTLKDADLSDSDPDPVGSMVPLATNIRSLTFDYYSDATGQTALVANSGAGKYDPTSTADIPERDTRKSILSVRINLVGLNEAQDPAYSNPTETIAAFKNYREFTLSSLIVPRNTGMKGIKEELTKGPDQPIIRSVCVGACGVPFLTWEAPVTGGVDFYTILYDTDPAGAFTAGEPVGNVTSAFFPAQLVPGTRYYFKIQASNGYGQSVSDVMLDGVPLAATTPNAPASLAATSGATALNSKIGLQWPQVVDNVGTPLLTCNTSGAASATQPGDAIPPYEVIKYRVWRGTTASFDPTAGEGELVCDEFTGAPPYTVAAGVVTMLDTVPNCIPYYYRVQAVADKCGITDSYNTSGSKNSSISDYYPVIGTNAIWGQAASALAALAPTNLTAVRGAGCPAGQVYGPNITCNLDISWDQVTRDTASNPIVVRDYSLYRQQIKPTLGAKTLLGTVVGDYKNPTNRVTYTDATRRLTDDLGETRQYVYSVTADQCSVSSAAATVNIPPVYYSGGTPTITSTASSGDGLTIPSAWGLLSGDDISVSDASMVKMTAIISSAGTIVTTINTTGSSASIGWPGFTDGTNYEIDFLIYDAAGNVYTVTRYGIDEPGVCAYTGGVPAITVSRAQAAGDTGLTAGVSWKLTPGDTITVTEPSIASVTLNFLDPITGAVLSPPITSTGGSPRSFTWPTLSYGTTYRVDILVQDASGCQVTLTRFVKQICVTYSGGTPVITSADVSGRTGLTSATAWQLQVGQNITVNEGSMTNLNVTVTDTSSGTVVSTASLPGTSPINFPWPSLTNATIYKVDMTLQDSIGCTSVVYTRYVQQYCPYAGGTPTVASSASTGLGTSGSPWYMVFSKVTTNTSGVDYLTITEASINRVIMKFTNVATGTLDATVNFGGTSPMKIYPPVIAGKNDVTYRVDITLQDSSGCQTSTPTTVYIKQRPCCMNTGVTRSWNGSTTETITFHNNCSQPVLMNNVKIYWNVPPGTSKKLDTVAFPGGTQTLASRNAVQGVVDPGSVAQRTVAAGSGYQIVVTFSYNAGSTSPITDVSVNYDSTVAPTQNNDCSTILGCSNNPFSCTP